MLEISDLTIANEHRLILNNFSATFKKGESIALMGPSGCGKSTTLKAIAGLITRFKSGQIKKDDVIWQDGTGCFLSPRLRNATLVFQDLAVWPHLTVKEQLDLILPKNRHQPFLPTAEIIDRLGLSHLTTQKARFLSGGEKQRLAIGRALKALPEVLLLDEPFNALDGRTKINTIKYLRDLQNKFSFTLAVSTHDHNDAILLEARVLRFGT